MAFRKMLAKRLYDGGKVASPSITEYSPLSSATLQSVVPLNSTKTNIHREYVTSPESAEKGFLRGYLRRKSQNQHFTFQVVDELREKLREFDMNGNRLRLNDLKPPSPDRKLFGSQNGLSVNDAKKILRISQVEMLKSKLREIPKSSISYSEFINICVEHCGNEDQGYEHAKMLDDYGNVIVLGNVVFLRPEQVAKSMETFVCQIMAIPNDPRREELEQLEKHKAIIDQQAKALVRGELYSGLGFLLFQTFAAIRLTFWELSWDVMEPICFFVGSLHFALAYAFFLRTSTEPSFQSYYQRRFTVKQKRLMEVHSFDTNKYTQLCKVFYPDSSNLKNSYQFSPLIDSFKHQVSNQKFEPQQVIQKTISSVKFVERKA